FESEGEISFTQKLTPSPYNYISYNHQDIPISVFSKKNIKPKSRLMIAGIKTEEIYVHYEGKLLQILFEFTASGFYYLFHQSPVKFKNNLTELNRIFSTREVTELEKKISKTDNIDKQILLIENLLLSRISEAKIPNLYLEKSIDLIERNHGIIHIQNIVEQVEVCERQLNRKFKEVVGISPKKFSKILQLHYLIYLIQRKKYPIQEIVFKGFFYDRPHFTHTFKELTGMTPGEFIDSSKHIAFEYFTSL
ncbi:MAG: helix-turn-helix transcriptional regulator, partial [Ignavibacteriaceae bacterium]